MIDADAQLPTRPRKAGASSGKIQRLLAEIDALIDADESAERRINGAWKTFDDINAAANANTWDAYSIDLSVDTASYRQLNRRQQQALLRVFGTIYRAESIVDDWMDRIVAAIPARTTTGNAGAFGYDALRTALRSQEHDEKMHRGSLFRAATEVLGIAAADVERVARTHNNFVAETLFAHFNRQMAHLLRPGRPLEDVYTAIFIYGILSEDVIANSDVVIRRAKGNDKYSEYNLPGMREGQTNVRRDEGRHVRIAVLATHKFLDEHPSAENTLTTTCTEYLDLADTMLRRAKRSRGLIDAHLRESYGPDVDSLYYYLVNLKRLAIRLDELGLRETVRDIRDRVARAVAEFTDDAGNPVIGHPGFLARTLAPTLARIASTRGIEPI
jgi:ribonucleotide reductase beta subunit family protein with ferritin-like domain